MNNIISLRRVGLLLCNEFRRNGKTYLIFIAILAGMYILAGIFGGIVALEGITGSFRQYIAALTLLLPFVIYKDLFHPVKGLNFTLLPASNEEKYLTAFLQCAVIFPLGMIIIFWVLTLLSALLTGHNELIWNVGYLFVDNDVRLNSFSLGFFDSWFWQIVACQSFSLWAVHFFKTKKFWRAVLTWFCICFVILTIASITAFRIIHSNGMGFDFAGNTRFAHILHIFFSLILPVGFWAWGYGKMRRQQF